MTFSKTNKSVLRRDVVKTVSDLNNELTALEQRMFGVLKDIVGMNGGLMDLRDGEAIFGYYVGITSDIIEERIYAIRYTMERGLEISMGPKSFVPAGALDSPAISWYSLAYGSDEVYCSPTLHQLIHNIEYYI